MLTEQERRVALAVGSGAANKAVARDLVISIKTVEFHLGNVYRKFGIASRAELVKLIAARPPELFDAQKATLGNLPLRATNLIGREADLCRLTLLLERHRVVTLVGVGGVGKTTLGLSAARAAMPDLHRPGFEDGVWLVELGMTEKASDVAAVCTTALGLRHRSAFATPEELAYALGGQRRLIILDNCEHVLVIARAIAEAVVRLCPNIVVLATSRERLDIDGEAVYYVAPVTTDDEVAFGEFAVSSAASLFIERAAAVLGGFEPTESELPRIEELCRHLDGLPLALELAAARLTVLSVGDLCDRLDQRFRVLVRRSDQPNRHQSLLATVAWSYELLSEDEQRVFAALSVFTGDFDLTEVVAIAANMAPGGVEDCIVSLVEKSMLVVTRHETGNRFRLLETLREFARTRLVELGDDAVDDARERHMLCYAALLHRANVGLRGPQELQWHRVMVAEWHNVRTAVGTACDLGATATACEIIEDSMWWAGTRSRSDAGDWVQRALDLPGLSTRQQVLVTTATAFYAALRSDYASARQSYERARALERKWGGLAQPWLPLVGSYIVDWLPAIDLALEIQRRARAGADLLWEMIGLRLEVFLKTSMRTLFGSVHFNTVEVVSLANELVQGSLRVGAPSFIADANMMLGFSLTATDPTAAEERLSQALDAARDFEMELMISQARTHLANLYMQTRRPREALAILGESLRSNIRCGAWAQVRVDLRLAPAQLLAADEFEVAAEIRGLASEIPWDEPAIPPDIEDRLAELMGEPARDAAENSGRARGLAVVAEDVSQAIGRILASSFETAGS